MKRILSIIATIHILLLSSCDFSLEEYPYTSGGNMTSYPAGASQMVNSIYNVFWSSGLMKKSYMETIDMDHDHAAAPSWVVSGAGEGNITTHWSYNTPSDPFNAFYMLINRANYAIENLPQVEGLDSVSESQCMGEARFLRAFAYFHLVRMYGGVPLRLSSSISSDMERASVMQVYNQIEEDLLYASTALPEKTDNSNWGSANLRNTEFVWGVSGNSQTEYITNHLGFYYSAIPYNGRAWAGMSEHAFALYRDGDERGEHGIFHYVKQTFTATSAYVRIPDDAQKYPTGPDGRPSRAVADYYNIYFPTKWYLGDVVNPQPVTTEPGYSYQAQDVILIRFVDAYLLRAEALNELGDAAGALDDLDVVRKRAKAALFERFTTDKTTIRSLVLEERSMEFMQEFNRKFDLLRWGLYLKVMNSVGSVRVQGTGVTITKTREPRSTLYAVPLNELNINKKFGPNNPGW